LKASTIALCLIGPLAVASAVSPQTPAAPDMLTSNPVYEKNCAKCHGKTAEGRMFAGPSLANAKTAGASADDLRNVITNGKGHMPKFTGKLSGDEIDTLVKQMQALNKK
jgi:mono/diheme cytochrome c family protein